MKAACVIAIVGAESTGKTTLAQRLAERLAADTGLRCCAVPEWLRTWCEREGRTPRQPEQAAIARTQAERIDEAARHHDVVIADTTPLMTAIYSRMLFGDDSLMPGAIAFQRSCDATLLTALDLPWVADGLQRDGPQVREPVDRLLRTSLMAQGLGWSVVAGDGERRVSTALDAVAPLLRQRRPPRDGLFSRLQQRQAEQDARPWRCERCDDPECEHRLRRRGA